jgi:arylsulfatase A-like enzyme
MRGGLAAALAAFAALCIGACRGLSDGPRPSVVLFVADTVRADAVSSYGQVRGTTPHLDALAAQGLRYARAYAAAPWTLPSHASLFTGRRVDERYPAELYDVRADPEERDNLAATAAEPFAALRKELAALTAATGGLQAHEPSRALDLDVAEALESLGYLD